MSGQSPSSKEKDSSDTSKKPVKEIRQIGGDFALWLRRFYNHRRLEISVVIGVTIVLIETVFQDQLEQALPAAFSTLANFFTSQTGIAVLGFTIIALQAIELRWISSVSADMDDLAKLNEPSASISTDGGRDTQPRDNKGRFKSSDSGPSVIFILAVVAIGFLIGSQYGDVEAIVGALLAFLVLSLTDNI